MSFVPAQGQKHSARAGIQWMHGQKAYRGLTKVLYNIDIISHVLNKQGFKS